MNFSKIALFTFFVALSLAQSVSAVNPEENIILMALLQSPALKEGFVQSCTKESVEWLGTAQADKSCNCAFDRIAKDPKVVEQIIGSLSADGKGFDFEKLGYGLVEPCLPKDFPAETDNAFVKECLKAGDLTTATCECMLNSVKKDYTVHTLIKTAFEDKKKLELDITLKAAQCLAR